MTVRLRPLEVGDWQAVHGWASRAESCRYQSWGPNTDAETEAFVRAAMAARSAVPPTRFVYAFVLDGRVVGSGELNLRGSEAGEISYVVHPDFWGRGIATAAARQLVDLGFAEHGLHRVFATCDPRNVGSARVLRRLGMTYEGRMREVQLIRDGWRDSELFSVLVHEWSGRGAGS